MDRIFGKGVEGGRLTEVGEQKAQEFLDSVEEHGERKDIPELEKSPEDLAFIEEASSLLKGELDGMGVEENRKITPNYFHFLTHEEFEKLTPENLAGFTDAVSHHVYIDESHKMGATTKPSRVNELALLLHESVHIGGHAKYYYEEEEQRLHPYRTGYRNHNIEGEHEHFYGLNEAVTESMIQELLKKNKAVLSEKYNFTDEDWSNFDDKYYQSQQKVLTTVIDGVAKSKGEDPEAVRARFKKSAFTGELMHMRDIEDVFGKGSLRVVAAMDSGTQYSDVTSDPTSAVVNNKILEYLTIKDPKRKAVIAESILNDREQEAYAKRRQYKKRERPSASAVEGERKLVEKKLETVKSNLEKIKAETEIEKNADTSTSKAAESKAESTAHGSGGSGGHGGAAGHAAGGKGGGLKGSAMRFAKWFGDKSLGGKAATIGKGALGGVALIALAWVLINPIGALSAFAFELLFSGVGYTFYKWGKKQLGSAMGGSGGGGQRRTSSAAHH